MMGFAGAKRGKKDHEKSPESPPAHHLHHHHLTNQSPKSIIWIFLLVIAVDLSCLLLYHSAYQNYLFLATSQYSQESFPSQDSSFRQAKIFSSKIVAEGPSSSSSLDSAQPELSRANLSPPTESVPQIQSSPAASDQGNLSFPANQQNEETKLERVLREAAMVNKTVIITTVNSAWMMPNSIFDLFLESFRVGNQTQVLLNHLIVVAFDQEAQNRCLELHSHCYALRTEGVDFSSKVDFMSEEYLKMMWSRIGFLHTVLKMGYSFIFTDADIVWFRDPFQQFYEDADFQIACDQFRYNSTDLNNSPNAGFTYAKSSNATIQFYKFWYDSKDTYPWSHDQHVLNKIKFDPFIDKIGLKIKFLDTTYFGGFCEPSKDLDVVFTMHANCCTSLDSKIHDLNMVIDDWKRYMTLPRNQTKPNSWTMPRYCGNDS
ncbi:uncharacterized protein At4g15970-like [Coffea eugenioides]|uniref:uncharacterized protein At4g15970-like n=1 Tax=Coffea eugenioides TaxID=49369 RepID=UPI000F607B98|nr:uncharacterized protein At4g15970-like [Coffea eugenioides]